MQESNKSIFTIEQIIERHGTEWFQRHIEIAYPLSGEIFVSRLYAEIENIVRMLEQTAHLRQDDKEDRITLDVIHLLCQAGYDASHDTDSRGHVDILVRNKTFVWLGEAKIHGSYDWLLDGLKQLQTRYLTGREEGSGILIYIKGPNAKKVMDEWRKRLVAGSECNLKKTSDEPEKLTFWSVHQHEGSGLDISTKHIGVSLFYKPQK